MYLREKKAGNWLIKRLMSWSPKKDGVKDDRILSDVYPKGIRLPMTDGLTCGEVSTSFSKGSGAARSDRLTSDLFGEKGPET